MAVQLKPIGEQVIVITGASSGIGLTTARSAAERGARLVLAARNEQALMDLQSQIQEGGGQAVVVVADVGNESDVRRISDAAQQAFGGFDTWINNAGVSIYGKIEEVPIEDHRRLFETNFWGVVYGSRIACETLRQRGGALINLGSIVSERAIPLQGMYSASKHAVMGFTEALRMELEKDGAPVSVTLIMPSAIDTPYPEHAKAYTDEEPTLPPPVYDPQVVADAILYAAEHPKRTITVGGGGRMLDVLGQHAPWLMDKVMEWTMFGQQVKRGEPVDPLRQDSLYRPRRGGRARGDYEGHVMRSSLYTRAAMHPIAAALLLGGAAVAGLALAGVFSSRGRQVLRRARTPRYLQYEETYREGGLPPDYQPQQEEHAYLGGLERA